MLLVASKSGRHVMRILGVEALPSLPKEVKALVHDGVYALYDVDYENVRYLLVTDRPSEYYFLSANGDVVSPPVRDLQQARLLGAVSFASTPSGGVRINAGV